MKPRRRSTRLALLQDSVPRRGISLLPNLITSMGLFCGIYSLVQTMQSNYAAAALAILAAQIFDSLDGRVARMTNSTSRFGIEYDSLCDLVSFGVAPGLLIYIMVDDMESTIKAVVANGGEIVQPIGMDAPEITARFRDPGGNVFGLYQEPSRAARDSGTP